MPTPASVATDDIVQAVDVNQYKNLLEGASTYTATYALTSTASTNFVIKLGDAAGTNKLSIQDSGGVEVASINSDGTFSGSVAIGSGTFTLPVAASPAPTTEGQAIWDTDDNLISVGDGAASKILIPSPTTTAGDIEYASGARAHSRLAIGTAGQILKVNSGATAPEWSALSMSTIKQADFRARRILLGEFSAVGWLSAYDAVPTSNTPLPISVGFAAGQTGTIASNTFVLTNALLEAYVVMTGATGNVSIGSVSTGAVVIPTTAPNKNPRMLIRWFPGASSANLTTSIAGFVANGAITATVNGAYLRASTTGNLFFVTRQGTETTTDLGARPTTPTSYEIETVDSGVTWTCRNTTTGTVVATHTLTVPTATTALGHVVGGVTGATVAAANVTYVYVEGDTVA